MWWSIGLALAGDTEAQLCRALWDRDVETVESLVQAGQRGDVFCEWAELGMPERERSSGKSGRRQVGNLIGVAATGGLLAPLIGGGGGSHGERAVELALKPADDVLLAALNSAGDLDGIQWCFQVGIHRGDLRLARRCGGVLETPVLTGLRGDLATPARLALIAEIRPAIELPRVGAFLDWGPSWARNPDAVELLVDLGLTRENLATTASDAMSHGPLVGLDVLRDRFDVPLRPAHVGSKWITSARFRRELARLEPDLRGARAKWGFLEDELVAHPEAIQGLLDLGLPPSRFAGAVTALLDEGYPATADRLLAAGAPQTVDFIIGDLLDRPDLREFIQTRQLRLAGTWTSHPWSDADTERVLTDPEMREFVAAVGISMCQAVEVAAETEQLALLHGQVLADCDEDALMALSADPALLLAASPDRIPPAVASPLAAQALVDGDLETFAFYLAHSTPRLGGFALDKAVRGAFDAGHVEAGAAGLAVLADVESLARTHPEAVARHLPSERFAELELPHRRSRQALFEAALAVGRWDLATVLVPGIDEPRERMLEAVDAGGSAAVLLALVAEGVDPYTPVDLVTAALERGDPELLAALVEAGVYASTDEVVSAFDQGFDPRLVASMVHARTGNGALRRLRKRAAAAGWSQAEVDALRRPPR